MYRRLMVFVVLSIIGAASIYNLTTFEAYAQGGIMGLIANGAQDVYTPGNPQINISKNFQYQRPLVETPPSNPSSSASEQSPPSGASGGGGLMGLIANGAQDVYTPGGTLSCSEGQVLDEQSGFCVPKELETAEEQPQAAEEQPQAAEEQPEQQSFDDEGDGLDDTSNDDNSGNDEDDN
jgi:hypothetical protein